MATTFETVREIIKEVADIREDQLMPDTNLVALGIDSVDFLDIGFELEQRFNITLPLEEWSDEIANGSAPEDYFVVRRFCERIDELAVQSGVARNG